VAVHQEQQGNGVDVEMTEKAETGHIPGTAPSEKAVTRDSAGGTSDRTTNGLPAPRLLDYKAAGAYLSLSYWSLRELILNGEIPHLKFGKKVLIDKEDLDQWITRNKETGVY